MEEPHPGGRVVRVFSHVHDAQLARSALQAAGIESWLQDHNTVAANWLYSNALGGVKLLVRDEDAEPARNVLDMPAVVAFSDDPSRSLPDTDAARAAVCPRCRSRSVAPVRRGVRAAFLTWLLLGLPLIWVRRRMRCHTCGRTFTQR